MCGSSNFKVVSAISALRRAVHTPQNTLLSTAASLKLLAAHRKPSRPKHESSAARQRRIDASVLYPGLFTSKCDAADHVNTLVVPAACGNSLLDPVCCAHTDRVTQPWTALRPPVLKVDNIEQDLMLTPLQEKRKPYHDLCIIDIIKLGVPLGMYPEDSISMQKNHSTAQRHNEWLTAEVQADLRIGRIQEIGPTSQFEHIISSERYGRKMAAISPITAFDKNQPDRCPKYPKKVQAFVDERAQLSTEVYSPVKMRKLDDLSFPDKGGKSAAALKSVNSRYIHNAEIHFCDLSIFIPELADFLKTAKQAGKSSEVVGFKIDHAQGYRHVTLSALLAPLHCFQLNNVAYMNTVMCFGGRPFAGIYARLTNAFQWALQRSLADGSNDPVPFVMGTIIDDSIYVTFKDEAAKLKAAAVSQHDRWGIQRNTKKDAAEGTPSSIVNWYGIDIDLITGTLSIPSKKKKKYLLKVLEALDARKLTWKELDKLHGMLSWASAVIVPGRSHLFHLRSLLASKAMPQLSTNATFELHFWKGVLESDTTIFSNSIAPKERISLVSDAAPSRGVGGAYLRDNELHVWAYEFTDEMKQWPEFSRQVGALEFFGILCNVVIFADFIEGKHVDALTDSKSSEATVNLKYARKDKAAATMLRELLIKVSQLNSSISATHIPGEAENAIADTLSRHGIQGLIQLIQHSDPNISIIQHDFPVSLLQSLQLAWEARIKK